MADCKQSVHEFIQSTYSPMVAVLCSNDAESVCQKNNLCFIELVQPFCRLTSEVHIRDPSNLSHAIHNLKVIMKEFDSLPPQPLLAKKMLSEVVSSCQPTPGDTSAVMTGEYNLHIATSTPWYEQYREDFLQVLPPAEHEFLRHYVACIFVVSTNHAEPLDIFHKLNQQQHQQQHQTPKKLPKWFSPNIFKYYVLLHDVTDGEESKAEAVYQSMKSTYGAHACHLLQINSCDQRTAQYSSDIMPDPWSQFLGRKFNIVDSSPDDEAPSLPEPPAQCLPLELTTDGQATFPNSVMEASLSPSQSDGVLISESSFVENASEATEGSESSLSSTNPVEEIVDHPLLPDNEEPPGGDLHKKHAPLQNHVNNDPLFEDPLATLHTSIEKRKHMPHGICLTLSDHDRLRIFVHEFCVRGLLPYVERQIRTLNDQLMSRKGIHRSLFSATKKWFGGSKPVTQGLNLQNTLLSYGSESPELQVRRLADLCFMFQMYELAYQSYHTAKRDFSTDHAWPHFAGSLEMAALSVFMQGVNSQRQYPNHYMETAISTYLSTCKLPEYATRATMFSTEVLKYTSNYSDAAINLIKMTSEDSDLRSGLLLEQAAYCFIHMPKPMVRKYAFHMILAGHRFSKVGQRKHALRSYCQALQVYRGRHWSLAEDHINFTIGRQSFNLKQLENATNAFKHLLTNDSQQTASQQNAFVREYLFVYKQLLAQTEQEGCIMLAQLPLPVIDGTTIKLITAMHPTAGQTDGDEAAVGAGEPISADVAVWERLEQIVCTQLDVDAGGGGSLQRAAAFRPTIQCFTQHTNNTHHPLTVVDGTCPHLHVRLTPHMTGKLHITGLGYNLGTQPVAPETASEASAAGAKPSFISTITVRGKQSLEVQGLRLNSSKAEKASREYADDHRLDPVVVPSMPCLQVSLRDVPPAMLCGELRRVSLELRNAGRSPLRHVYVATSHPEFLAFSNRGDDVATTGGGVTAMTAGGGAVRVAKCQHSLVKRVPLPPSGLPPGGAVTLPAWIRGLNTSGRHKVHMLFYYLPQETTSKLRYRVLRYTASLTMNDSVAVQATASRQYSDWQEGLVVSLEAANMNQVQDSAITEVSMTQVICASSSWTLHPLSQIHKQDVKLNPAEKTSLCFKSVRLPSNQGVDEAASAVHFSCAYSDNESGGGGDDDDETYSAAFLMATLYDGQQTDWMSALLSRTGHPQHHQQQQQQQRRQPDTRRDAALDVAVRVDLTVIVFWKAFVVNELGSSTTVYGRHHLQVETLNTICGTLPMPTPTVKPVMKFVKDANEQSEPVTPALLTDASTLEQLVTYCVRHPALIQHDFTQNRLCVARATVILHNCCEEPVSVRLNTSSRDTNTTSTDGDAAEPAPSPAPPASFDRFTWAGASFVNVRLRARQTAELQLRACVCRPGVFNLSDFAVTAAPDSGAHQGELQRPIPQSLVIVQHSES
ncbi:PREDICTED: trafficking protein particle complex subunit 8-like [Priapulus caudatus]|uniref:Trafficking protein particle complex subunit 8-like n=1 Tax=Priapulus caudatus TaxID=37621 RepID=A0ABM1EUR0_PRICU|nr:PREDICTED: trafficking protein particle complex subunit 8-like [Priapulus caudatus]